MEEHAHKYGMMYNILQQYCVQHTNKTQVSSTEMVTTNIREIYSFTQWGIMVMMMVVGGRAQHSALVYICIVF